ncbi:hypothetical protein, partial [Fluviicola sp.]|uniref:hypothetical protein n=1 Tax=Fluviicola sp. TaxID=1917219 RepID=UPI002613F3F5
TIAASKKESSIKKEEISDAKKDQQKALEDISTYIAKQNNHDLLKEFNSLTSSIKSISDSLSLPLNPSQINILNSNYAKLNNSVSELVIKIADQPVNTKKITN